MIPESFIQEVLNRIDVVDIVDQRVKLKKSGANFVACCPFHQEKSPSFTVSPSKQFYHCFGCGAHGSAISFLMEYDGLTFVESIQLIANQLGLTVPNEQSGGQVQNDYSRLEEVLSMANKFYKKILRETPVSINYLKNRGLSGETARQFQIGFSPNEWQGLQTVFSDYEENVLQAAGLVQRNEKGRLYDRFRNRIMFPILNAKNTIIGFGGRVIDDNEKPKYYNSPETPLFKKSYELYGIPQAKKGIREDNNIIIVEGYMDVISLHQHGITNAVATLGTATTIYHIKKLVRYSKKITFCFDGDQAGREAAWKALNTAIEVIDDQMEFYFLFLPANEDPDTFIKKNSPDKFKTLINNATPLTEFIIRRLTSDNDLRSQEKKIKFLNSFEPIVKKIYSSKYRLFLIKRVSELLSMSQVELEKIIGEKFSEGVNIKIKYAPSTKNTLTAKRKYLLILLSRPDLFEVSDHKCFNGTSIEDEIFIALSNIFNSNNSSFNNSASIFASLSNYLEDKLIAELQTQVMDFGENIDLKTEMELVRSVLQNISSKRIQSEKLSALKNKSLSDLTDEDKEFLKNFKK